MAVAWAEDFLRLGALAGAAAAVALVVGFLYRKVGIQKVVRWLTRHVREDRAKERTDELLAVLMSPQVLAQNQLQIERALAEKVQPELELLKTGHRAIHKRIDEHMETEDQNLVSVALRLGNIDDATAKLSNVTTQLTSGIHEILEYGAAERERIWAEIVSLGGTRPPDSPPPTG